MRIKIAEHMVLSKRTSAHVTTIHRVDMTAVAQMRERNKAAFQANYGFNLTYLPFITRAVVVAPVSYTHLSNAGCVAGSLPEANSGSFSRSAARSSCSETCRFSNSAG